MTNPADRYYHSMYKSRKTGGFSVLRVFFALAVAIPLMGLIWKHHYDQVWDGVDDQIRPYMDEERRRIADYYNSEEGKADIEKQRRLQKLAKETIKDFNPSNDHSGTVLGGEPDEEDMKALRRVAREERKKVQEFLESEEGKKYMEEQRRLQQKARETIKD